MEEIEFTTTIQADGDTGTGSAHATGISGSEMTGERLPRQCDECVSGSSCWVRGNPPPQDVQVTNELINDPEKQTAILGAVSLPPGADASLYLGLSLAFPWDVATILAFFPRRD